MVVRVPHRRFEPGAPPANPCWFVVARGDGGQAIDVWVSCPSAHVGPIDEHRVHADGSVEPSLICDACGWHEFVVLDGWTLGPRAPAGGSP